MAEQIIEVHGAGFIPGLSGIYANCQIVVEDGKVLRVEPLGTGESLVPIEYLAQVQIPAPGVLNMNITTSAQPVEQASIEENQGG